MSLSGIIHHSHSFTRLEIYHHIYFKDAIVSLSCRIQHNVVYVYMLTLKAHAHGPPQVRDFGKPTSARNFGLVMTSPPSNRPPDRTYVRKRHYVIQCEMRHSNPVLQPGIFRREMGWPTSFRKTNEKFEEN